MRIVFFETEGWEPEQLQSMGKEHDVVFTPSPLSLDNVQEYRDAEIIAPFVHSKVDRAVLDQLKNLKYIATRSTGYDHIDIASCSELAIPVSNVPVYGTNTVAEHAFALLLAISHHIPEAVTKTRSGDFSGAGLRGFDLFGKTLGIIGTGNIGKRGAEIGLGFGMQVLAFDIEPDTEFATRQPIKYVSFEELLRQSDCLSLHVPGGASTLQLLSRAQFAQMKKGMVIINTARGTVIDTQALLAALNDGTVAAAGIDVLPEESAMKSTTNLLGTLPADMPNRDALLANLALLRHDRVIITPHSAFNTREAIARILQTTAENILAFIANETQNCVNS